MTYKKNQRGIALITTLMVLMALMVLTMGFAAFTTTDYAVSQSYNTSTINFYLAQAGMDYTIYLMSHNMLIFPISLYSDATVVNQEYSYVGQASNVFHVDSIDPTNIDLQGEEHLVISELSWGSFVDDILGAEDYCGTFQIFVDEREDTLGTGDPRDRVLIARSIGKIRYVPGGQDPLTGDYDSDTFPVRARRTLIMRLPYRESYEKDHDVYKFAWKPDASLPDPWVVNFPQLHYNIINDGWFERFR